MFEISGKRFETGEIGAKKVIVIIAATILHIERLSLKSKTGRDIIDMIPKYTEADIKNEFFSEKKNDARSSKTIKAKDNIRFADEL